MTDATIAVWGGSGKTGRSILAALRKQGREAAALGREATKDPVAALGGVEAMYLMAPNMHADEPGYVARLLDAAINAGVRRVVYHSVAAPYAPDMPHHYGKAVSENLVRTSGLEWAIIQPCAYVQNFVPALIGEDPRLLVPYSLEAVFGFVDLDDVAEAAALLLLDDGLIGTTIEAGGPELVSLRDVARAASEALETDVPIERISTEMWRGGPGVGLEQREADWLVAMFDYYDRNGLPTGSAGLAGLLARQPRSVAETLRRELVGL